MTWDAIEHGVGKALKMNSWPPPFNFMKNHRVLLCSEDYWIAEFEFAFDVVMDFFWSAFVPSPRELERKVLTGGYRCGFYLDIKVKSPIEILFGQGTSKMVGKIFSPFATGLFYWWAAQTAIDALSVFETILFRQLMCAPFTGDVLRQNDRGVIEAGGSYGVPALGTLYYNPRAICEEIGPICHYPPGYQHAYATFLFTAAGGGMTDIKTGWQKNGVVIEQQDHGGLAPFTQKGIIREIQFMDITNGELAPWCGATNGPGVVVSGVDMIVFVFDNEEFAPPNYPQNLIIGTEFPPRSDPKCATTEF